MIISSAYMFARQITAGAMPVVIFENGAWNASIMGEYWRSGGLYGPVAPGVFTACRQQVMSEYGASAFHNSQNLLALGSKYGNFYSMDTVNITRDCHTGSSIDQSGYSHFLPLANLTEEKSKIVVEYRINNSHAETYSYTHLLIGALRINGEAYETIAEAIGNTISNDWNTLTVTLPSPEIIKAIEMQSGYGIYEIKRITLL